MSVMGRPKGTTGIPQKMTKRGVVAARKMALVYAEEALEKIVDIMRDEEADHAVQLKAANDVLNRAYGTPVSMQIVEKIESDANNGSNVNPAQIGQASTDELQSVLATLQRYLEAESKTVDVTPIMPDGYPES